VRQAVDKSMANRVSPGTTVVRTPLVLASNVCPCVLGCGMGCVLQYTGAYFNRRWEWGEIRHKRGCPVVWAVGHSAPLRGRLPKQTLRVSRCSWRCGMSASPTP